MLKACRHGTKLLTYQGCRVIDVQQSLVTGEAQKSSERNGSDDSRLRFKHKQKNSMARQNPHLRRVAIGSLFWRLLGSLNSSS